MIRQKIAIDLAVAHPYKIRLRNESCEKEMHRIFGGGALGEHIKYGGKSDGTEYSVVRLEIHSRRWLPVTDEIRKIMTAAFNEARPKGVAANWRFMGYECWIHRTVRSEGDLDGHPIKPYEEG